MLLYYYIYIYIYYKKYLFFLYKAMHKMTGAFIIEGVPKYLPNILVNYTDLIQITNNTRILTWHHTTGNTCIKFNNGNLRMMRKINTRPTPPARKNRTDYIKIALRRQCCGINFSLLWQYEKHLRSAKIHREKLPKGKCFMCREYDIITKKVNFEHYFSCAVDTFGDDELSLPPSTNVIVSVIIDIYIYIFMTTIISQMNVICFRLL